MSGSLTHGYTLLHDKRYLSALPSDARSPQLTEPELAQWQSAHILAIHRGASRRAHFEAGVLGWMEQGRPCNDPCLVDGYRSCLDEGVPGPAQIAREREELPGFG